MAKQTDELQVILEARILVVTSPYRSPVFTDSFRLTHISGIWFFIFIIIYEFPNSIALEIIAS